jgi:hypothetical protein
VFYDNRLALHFGVKTWRGRANIALAGIVDIAETARQQGVAPHSMIGRRGMASLEFQAQFPPPNNAPAPPKLPLPSGPSWEIRLTTSSTIASGRAAQNLLFFRWSGPLERTTKFSEGPHPAGNRLFGLPPIKK